jgi:hypothetical protein
MRRARRRTDLILQDGLTARARTILDGERLARPFRVYRAAFMNPRSFQM